MEINKMRNVMRLVAFASAVALATGGSAALAGVSVDGENNTTGPDSVNRNVYDIENDSRVTVTNDSNLNNTVDVAVNSGNNTVSTNTTVEDVVGGDVEVSGEFVNEANNGDLDIDMDSELDVSADFTNDTTGPNSENVNRLNVDNTSRLTVNNDARVRNNFDLNINTGRNDVRRNTTVGDVRSGNIDVNLDVENVANSSTSSMNLSPAMVDVSADFTNDTTGPFSENRNTLNVSNDSRTTVNNTANVTNTVDVVANTGRNDVRRNTTVGDVETGSVTIDFRTVNQVN